MEVITITTIIMQSALFHLFIGFGKQIGFTKDIKFVITMCPILCGLALML